MITFNVSDVNPGNGLWTNPDQNWILDKFAPYKNLPKDANKYLSTSQIESYLSNIDNAKKQIHIEYFDVNQNGLIWSNKSNSFIQAVYTAYQHHYPLMLSPDDFWLLILQGIATHIHLDSEKYRLKFVNFLDKKELVVERHDFIKGSKANNWTAVVEEFSAKVGSEITESKNIFDNPFSTTKKIEQTAFRIALMDSMSNYFRYTLLTMCGIPKIILLGKKEDWQDIIDRLEAYSDLGLDFWFSALKPVLQNIVLSFDDPDSKENKDFWQNFFKEDDESGGPYITGWINSLFPYICAKTNLVLNPYVKFPINRRFGDGLTTDEYPSSLSKVNFVWKYYDEEIPMEFVSGFLGVHQSNDDFAISPAIGWAVKYV